MCCNKFLHNNLTWSYSQTTTTQLPPLQYLYEKVKTKCHCNLRQELLGKLYIYDSQFHFCLSVFFGRVRDRAHFFASSYLVDSTNSETAGKNTSIPTYLALAECLQYVQYVHRLQNAALENEPALFKAIDCAKFSCCSSRAGNNSQLHPFARATRLKYDFVVVCLPVCLLHCMP